MRSLVSSGPDPFLGHGALLGTLTQCTAVDHLRTRLIFRPRGDAYVDERKNAELVYRVWDADG